MSGENVHQTAIQELLAVANEYCWFIEHISDRNAEFASGFFRKILPLLYVKGCMIAPAEDCDGSFMQRHVTEETYEIVFNDIRNCLKPNDVFYIYNTELNEPEEKSLAEALADIYQDLKDGLIAWVNGAELEKESAVYYLHQWFVSRWGKQTTVLIPVFHRIFENTFEESQTGTEFD